jgi:hypothetical protein
MRHGNLIGQIVFAVFFSCICVLGLTGCSDSGPTPPDMNSAPAPAPAPGSLTITTTALPNGTVNQAYSTSLSGSGGTVPYTWSVTPALPAGLALNAATGAITGTPTAQGTTSHTFTLHDSSNPSQTVQQTLSLTINAAPTHHLTVNTSGNGTVTSSPSGISCGTTCQADFPINSIVTLTAAPAAGSTFTGWSGAGCSGTGTCAVVMNADQTVAASFATLNTFTLTVTKQGVGLGTVTSSPPGIDCGATCSFNFTSGTMVTLTATPSAGSTFGGWSGSGCSGTGTCVVVMSQNRSVTATFNAVPSTLTVTKAGTGAGTVTSSPAGINCGNTCSASFPTNSSVTLTAAAAAGSIFVGWSGGGCSGTGTCTTVMATSQTVVATFNAVPMVTLTVTKSGTGTGTVMSSPGGINCGNTCSASFAQGTVVTLTATPTTGGAGASHFVQWSGGCTGAGSCIVTMNANTTVNAQFAHN